MQKFILNKTFISKYRIWIALCFIVVLAAFWRFYQLSNVPPSASLDEATIGWNAYSILLTGKDEYKTFLPLLLRAYDDYRPALYVYLVIPFIKIFGLSVLSVRLPSAILSTISVFSVFFLTKELFSKYKYQNILGLLVSFLLAISPWHIYISRLGHEVNPASTFTIIAILLFLKAMHKNRKLLYLSVIFFVLSFYAYQSEKVFVPLMVIILSMVYYKRLVEIKKETILSAFIGIIMVVPILMVSLSPQGLLRFSGTSAFSQGNRWYYESAQRLAIAKQHHNIMGEIINNRRITTLHIFLSNYLSHINPYWLFTDDEDVRFKAPGFGLLYLWTVPFLAIGILSLIVLRIDQKAKLIIASWFFLAFLAPAITTDAPHALRSLNVLPMFEVLIAIGLLQIGVLCIKYSRNVVIIFISVMSVVIVVYLIAFYRQYFIVFPKKNSQQFQYALAQAIPYIKKNDKEYKKIIFGIKNNVFQSYMFFLFYDRYNPLLYQKQGGTLSGGFQETHVFGKYEFRNVNWELEKKSPDILYVANSKRIPNYIIRSFIGYYLDGNSGVVVVKGNALTCKDHKSCSYRKI